MMIREKTPEGEDRVYYVYQQKCNGVVFYVGITANKLNRPFFFGAHNDKYEGFLVSNLDSSFSVVISEAMGAVEAREFECRLIKQLETGGVWLANKAWTSQGTKPLPTVPKPRKVQPLKRRRHY